MNFNVYMLDFEAFVVVGAKPQTITLTAVIQTYKLIENGKKNSAREFKRKNNGIFDLHL